MDVFGHSVLATGSRKFNGCDASYQWAAYATLSRITLYAASPWYNGNKFYADWQRTSDGANFISQENDNSKWGVSAAYSKYIIDSNKFELYWTPKEIDARIYPLMKNLSKR